MGILDKLKQIFSTKESAEQEEKRLKLAELAEFVQSRSKSTIDRDRKLAVEISKKIVSNFSEIKKLAESLEDAEPYVKGKFPDQIISAGRSSRDFFCRQAESVILRIMLPQKDYISLIAFKKQVRMALNQLNLDPKKAELFRFCFEKEAKLVGNQLTEINKQEKEISLLLSRDAAIFQSAELDIKLKEAIKAEAELKENNENVEKLTAQLKELEEFRQSVNNKIGKISTSEADKLAEEINLIRQKKKELLNKVSTEFSGLKKVLRKYQHKEPKETKGELENYIESFAETLVNDYDFKILNIVSELKTAVSSNKLILDSKARETSLACFGLLHKDYVENVQEQYNEMTKKVEELERQKAEVLAPIKEEKSELEKQQKELDTQIEGIIKEIKIKTKYKDSKDKELTQLKSELEKLASWLTKTRIIVN